MTHGTAILVVAGVMGVCFSGASSAININRYQPLLDKNGALRLATRLANEAAAKQYQATPFTESGGTVQLVRGRWEWEAVAGYGKGDLLAKISLTPNGSAAKVTVQPLTGDGY